MTFHSLAVLSVLLGLASAIVIAADETRRPQHMAIMYAVWPLAALFGSLLVLWFYWRWGRGMGSDAGHASHAREGHHGQDMPKPPFPVSVAKGALHCGAGCTLGDIAAEWLAFAVPSIAVALGYGTLFGREMFAVWVLDFVFAFAIGIVFQFFAIAPMRGLGMRDGLWAALKADTLSLTSWQVGMYGTMALAQLLVLPRFLGRPVAVDSAEFWFVMQVAMVVGFVTAFPVNWWLIRAGIKERM